MRVQFKYEVSDQHIGSDATMPYLSPMLTGPKLFVGANVTSAGIGILNDTEIQFVSLINVHFTSLMLYFD